MKRPGSDWSQRISAAVGAEVRRRREELGLLGKDVEEYCATVLKFDMPRSTLSKIETGSKAFLSVAELLVLAAALNTSPALLLAPVRGRGKFNPPPTVEELPDRQVPIAQALQWLNGEKPYFLRDADSTERYRAVETAWLQVMTADIYAQNMIADHAFKVGLLTSDDLTVTYLRDRPDDRSVEVSDEIDRLTKSLEAELARLRELRERMALNKVAIPELPAWLERHFASPVALPWGLGKGETRDA